ncbi:tRNA adenosine deaminase-associated protein [Pilimelia columellifera]|uniref:tRNA adenosine deaminase-associated protein n=1 Tax=Pilimelia columellifera TaxID=706574 RepID=UPI0031DE33FF
MSYFAAAAVRHHDKWSAAELSLSGVSDVEDVVDRLRDVAPDADLSLLFVESDDSYLVVLRLDEGEDLRVFGSDSIFAAESRLGALLLGDIEAPALEIEEPSEAPAVVDEEPAPRAIEPDVDPVGDADLLADLGVNSHRLLELCATEGLLPADVTAEVTLRIGCADEVEELREA